MRFNLLRSQVSPGVQKNYKSLVVILLIIIALVVYSLWQIRVEKQNVILQHRLNSDLQSDLLKLKNYYTDKTSQLSETKVRENTANIEKVVVSEVLEALVMPINYANAMELSVIIRDKTNALLSPKGSVVADKQTNTLWVQDVKLNLEKISKLLRLLDVPKKQVLIEARIVNMASDSAQDLGVKFGFLQNKSLTPGGHLGFDLGALPLAANPASIGFAIATLGQNALLDLELSALQSEGLAQIIASPRLITTNQEPAIIESGEDIPYQKQTINGGTAVAFKKAVLSLKVVPKITFDAKLIMSISINQGSDSGRRVQGVPIISTKSLETNVMIADNQTIVLGGIYKQDENNSIIRVPILGALPLLGGLFRRTEQKYRNEELLIFITPKILTATN